MTVVLDASAAVAVVLRRPEANDIELALGEAATVVVPELFVAEVTNVFWKYALHGGLAEQRCFTAVKRCLALSDGVVPTASLWEEALDLAISQRHPVYDCLYLALARRRAARLLTLDRRLAEAAKAVGVRR